MEATLGANLKVREVGFHRKQKHEAHALMKLLSAKNRDAMEALDKLLVSKDEKVVATAVKMVLELQRQLANDINQDELQRLIANVKFGGPRQLEVDDDTPQIDFTTVIDP